MCPVTNSPERIFLLNKVAEQIASISYSHPIRVGINGIDGAGKTWFADELAEVMRESSRPIIRATVDGFYRPRVERMKRGYDSAEGYYYDSFNYDVLEKSLLAPLGPCGTRQYRTGVYNFKTDSIVEEPLRTVSDDAILLLDGVFLFRPELLNFWDYKIFLDVDFLVAIPRACSRYPDFFTAPDKFLSHYCQRYMKGNRIYLEAVRPQDLADIVIDNNDFAHPEIIACKA
jgi:uridine kinase